MLGAGTALGDALAQRWEDGGDTVLRVAAAGDPTGTDGGRQTLDPSSREQYAELLALAADRPAGGLHITHLFSLAPAHQGRAGFDNLLALAQALGDARLDRPVAVDVLCQGVHSVTGDEPLQPENALLTGVCTVLPQEVEGVTCRLLDITGTDPQAPSGAAVRAVHELLAGPGEESVLALRGRHWWCRDFDPADLGPVSAGPVSAGPASAGPVSAGPVSAGPASGSPVSAGLRDGGVYLITGGLGGMGLAMAEHIADHAERPVLALLGRSEFPAEREWQRWLDTHGEDDPTSLRIRRLRRIREQGARVVVLRGDVTDPVRLGVHIAALRERFGGLNGVVHAAGVPASGMMATKTASDSDRVLAAKVHGTLALDQACAGEDLDFFLLCSSATAVLGGPGQSDYCAANAFLDTFAHQRGQQGAPVTAVAWGTWDGVGMAAGLGSLRGDAAAGEPTGHPLLRAVRAGDGSWTYASTFSTAESWIVDDHRLMGHGLVPGTAYLEIVRAALALRAGDQEINLHDVLFTGPVIVPDGQSRTVYTTIEERGDRLRFTVRSRSALDGTWREHASGSATLTARAADTVRDLDELLARCEVTDVLETEESLRRGFRVDAFAKGAGALEFGFGPRWNVLRKVQTGGRRMLATLALEPDFRSDLDAYPLHPALLDMAGGVFRLHARDLYYLPLAYRTLRVLHPLTPTLHCSVEIKGTGDVSGETLTCDIELLDPDGRLLVAIADFSVKRVNDVPALIALVEQALAEARAEAEDGGSAGSAPGGDEPGTAGAGALRALSEGMSEADGRTAFGRILAAKPTGQVVVSPKDFTAMRRLARSITPSLLARELAEIAPPAGTHPRPDLDIPFLAPATEDELAIAAIWQEVLGVEPVGANDDFFALGGHSLAAVQIGTRLQSRFGVQLDLRDFFSTPTVAHTATLLAAGRTAGAGGDDVIEVVRRDEPDTGPSDLDDELADLDQLSDEEVEARLQELLAEEAGGADGGRELGDEEMPR